jgi:glycosyltransferase involved in cell wall biosynthesis
MLGRRIILVLGISSYSGWGVYALNLALHWSMDPAIEGVCAVPILREQVVIESLRLRALVPLLERSFQFQLELQKFANGCLSLTDPVIVAVGNQFVRNIAAHKVALEGRPNIGVVFFEKALSAEAIERAKRYSVIITGSSWNERVLRACGIESVHNVLQGVDTSYFHPAPKSGLYADKFLIFSGGKAERRKGQDIVLAAFKIFAQRHPEAMLITAWHSDFSNVVRTLDQSAIVAPVLFDRSGQLDVVGWATANGIDAHQVIDLGKIPNMMMPTFLREVDVAIFPNRCEGGTNLVAMECMACGLPVILSRNTGHLDLIRDDNCYTLDDQREIGDFGPGLTTVPGWGESQVEEVVARLEEAHADRADARQRGVKASQTLASWTWAATAKRTKEIVLSAS